MKISSIYLYKLLLYLAVILKFPIVKHIFEINKLSRLYQQDVSFCPMCFSKEGCHFLQVDITFNEDFVSSINNMFGVKTIFYGQLPDGEQIVIKYVGSSEKFNYILGGLCNNSQVDEGINTIKSLKKIFLHQSRIDGLQFCPHYGIDRFAEVLDNTDNALSVWTHLNVNIQPLLLPILKRKGFPTPALFGTCGFTIFQSYEGVPLSYFYSETMRFRLKIAKQLLEAAFKFTAGFDGYKIYLTDANPDNIVYNELTDQISFIDIDSIIIVDSNTGNINVGWNQSVQTWEHIHKHDMIDCDGCFAYVPSEMCSHHESDLNLFAICQLLREDLYKDKDNGFLHSIPDDILLKYPELVLELEECLHCETDCTNRFRSARHLYEIINDIIFDENLFQN